MNLHGGCIRLLHGLDKFLIRAILDVYEAIIRILTFNTLSFESALFRLIHPLNQ